MYIVMAFHCADRPRLHIRSCSGNSHRVPLRLAVGLPSAHIAQVLTEPSCPIHYIGTCLRYAYLRRRSLSLRFFFRGSAHRAKHPQLPTITRPSSSRLSSLPALPVQAYVCSRARATDIAVSGRGGAGDSGSLSEEKEELPAYEDTRVGRPPGYVDVGLHANMGAVSLAPPARPRPDAPTAEENA